MPFGISLTHHSSAKADDFINSSKLWITISSIFMTSFQEMFEKRGINYIGAFCSEL